MPSATLELHHATPAAPIEIGPAQLDSYVNRGLGATVAAKFSGLMNYPG
jgi:hypothetical protein